MSSDFAPVRWGIIGPGTIATSFCKGAAAGRFGQVVAIGTRDATRPDLSERFPDARIIEGYEKLLADPGVEAVYIATPHVHHCEWAIRAAEYGKHVLVEKPLGISTREVEAVFDAHRKSRTFAGEAFMYRLHPQTTKLVHLIRDGTIGQVKFIQSCFGGRMPTYDLNHRLLSSRLGGGGIMDIGCYPASMARLIAGAAANLPFLNPVEVHGLAHLGEAGTDEWASAELLFENGIIAQIACAIMCPLDNMLRIFGDNGRIEVPNFWFANGDRDQGLGEINIIFENGLRETFCVNATEHLYSFEADAAADAIRLGRQQFVTPGMSWDDSIGNAQVLDAWRASIGLEFDIEKSGQRLWLEK